MKGIPSELKEIEKKDWRLWFLLISLFLILTSFIVLIVFYSDASNLFQEKLDIYSFNFLLIGYVGLSLLFIAYIIFQEISLRGLRRDLIKEKINLSITLGQRYRDLKALFEVSTVVNSEVEPNKILHLISKQAMNCLNADRSSLMILDPETNKLRCEAAYGYKTELLKDAEVEVGKGVCGWVVERNQPLLLDRNNINQYEFTDLVEKDETILSALCVPLKMKGKIIGILNVNRYNWDRRFSQEDLKLLSIFADNAAIAMENAELHQQYEKQLKGSKKIIDDLMSTQNQLIDSQKMRTLGDLARGMTHDFNNILTIVNGRAEIALDQTQEENVKKSLIQILKATSEARNTVRRIQEFYGTPTECGWVEIDVKRLIREVVEITRSRWEDEARAQGIKIQVSTEFSKVKPVLGNPSEIFEALTNLILNAVEAMPQGGKIILKSGIQGNYVVISVKDTGAGMNDEVKSRIFDPFFTTKTTGNAGLGLSVVNGVILRHKGKVGVDSKQGLGTTFTIMLPVSTEQKKEETKETIPTLPLDQAQVLVVDDSREVRDIVSQILETKGHKVTKVEDGIQAVELFEKKKKFDLVFVNLSMPKLSGWQVIQNIKKKDPEVRVALLTGWYAQIDFEDAKGKGVDFLISKPFKSEELLAVLSQTVKRQEITKKA